MTVTVASTTDTEADVKEATAVANEATKTDTDETPADEGFTLRAEGDGQPTIATATAESQSVSVGDESLDSPEASEPEVAVEDEEAVEATPTDPDPVATAPQKRRRRGRSYKDRASQLAREKADETLRANSLQAEIDRLKAAQAAQAASVASALVDDEEQEGAAEEPQKTEDASSESPAAEAKTATGKPNQEDFETYDEFQEALVDWKVSERLDKREAQDRERIERDRAQRTQEELVATHTARIDAFRADHSDFDAVIDKGKNLPLTRPMQDAIVNSETGPALMYHLCQHPEECDRIAAMHPLMAVKEMGKLEAQMETAPTGPVSSAESVTKAPRPIKPVGGGATASTIPPDQMSYQEFKRFREKQEAAERG
jgi:hypothetical protein